MEPCVLVWDLGLDLVCWEFWNKLLTAPPLERYLAHPPLERYLEQHVEVVPSTFCDVHICSSTVELFLHNFVLHHRAQHNRPTAHSMCICPSLGGLKVRILPIFYWGSAQCQPKKLEAFVSDFGYIRSHMQCTWASVICWFTMIWVLPCCEFMLGHVTITVRRTYPCRKVVKISNEAVR
jgi:hypothetical protein